MAVAQLPAFARLLRWYRLEEELTQEDLAERAGLSARAISDLERGVKIRPHRVTVERLADALQLEEKDRLAMLEAIPRTGRSRDGMTVAFQDRLTSGVGPASTLPQTLHCPRELRQMLEGVVALYLDEEKRDSQIHVTVIMFSVEGRADP